MGDEIKADGRQTAPFWETQTLSHLVSIALSSLLSLSSFVALFYRLIASFKETDYYSAQTVNNPLSLTEWVLVHLQFAWRVHVL